MAKKKKKEEKPSEIASIIISCPEIGFRKEATGPSKDLEKYWNNLMSDQLAFAFGTPEDFLKDVDCGQEKEKSS